MGVPSRVAAFRAEPMAHACSYGALGCPHNSSESGWRSLCSTCAPSSCCCLLRFCRPLRNLVCNCEKLAIFTEGECCRAVESWLAKDCHRIHCNIQYVAVRAEFNLLCTTIGPQVGPGTI